MLTPTYKSLPLFRLAGIRRWHTFATAPETIPPQWNEFNALPLPGRAEAPVSYGATCQMDMPNQRFEYLSGYEVLDFDDLPADIGRMIVPAMPSTPSSPSTPSKTSRPILAVSSSSPPGSHPPASSPAPTPNFERYDDRFDPNTHGPLEIWLPITR